MLRAVRDLKLRSQLLLIRSFVTSVGSGGRQSSSSDVRTKQGDRPHSTIEWGLFDQGIGAFLSIPKRFDLSFAGGFKFVANDQFFQTVQSGFGTLVAQGSFGGLAGLTDSGYASVTLSTSY
jgi:hypothetical protein